MSKIQSRPYEHGDPKECTSWPPKFPRKDVKGTWYWDEEKREMVRGLPPPKHNEFGRSAYIISDSMEAYRHPASGELIESKSRLKKVDHMFGTITTDKKIPPDPTKAKQLERERHEDLRKSFRKSIAAVDAGTAPLTEEVRAKCAITNEIMSKALGFDAFNVAGKKNDPRGKKYRRR